MKFDIGNKITALTFVLILSSAFIMGFEFYKQATGSLVDKDLKRLEYELGLEGARIRAFVEAFRKDIRFLAGVPPIQGIVRARKGGGADPADGSSEVFWRKRLAVIFLEYLKAKPEVLQARYIGVEDEGREIVRAHRTGDGGLEVAGDNLQRKGSRDYFQETIGLPENQVYISEVNLNRENGRIEEPHTPVIRIAVPVFDAEGRVFGVVALNIDFKAMLGSLGRQARQIFIANDSGDFLLHPDPEKTFGFDFGKPHRIQDSFPRLGRMFQPGNREVSASSLPENPRGDDPVLVFFKVEFDPSKPERFLALVKAVSYGEMQAEFSTVRERIAFLVVGTIGVCSFLAIFYLRRLTAPLRQIIRAADELSNERYEERLPIDAGGDMGILARSFHRTIENVRERTEALREARERLETRVKERTVELEVANELLHHENKIRLAAVKTLRESEARLSAVLDNIIDGVVTIDEKGVIKSCNRPAERIFGYSCCEMVGNNISLLIPEPHKSAHANHMNDYLATSVPRVIHTTRSVNMQRKGGAFFPAKIAIKELRLDDRRFFIGIVQDVTAIKEAEAALLKENLFLQLLKDIAVAANETSRLKEGARICLEKICALTHWPVGHLLALGDGEERFLLPTEVWRLDDAGKFEAFMKTTMEMRFNPGFGLPGSVLKEGRPVWIKDVDNDPNFPRRRRQAKDIGVRGGFAFPILIEREVVGVLEFFSAKPEEPDPPLLDLMGHVGALLGRVAERERIEKAQQRARVNLEKLVSERTRELFLANRTLQQFADELKRSNGELQAFAATASHDLQEPLRKIKIFGEMLEKDYASTLGEKGADCLKRMTAACRRMQQFIADLLEYSRITAKAQPFESIDLNNTVSDVLADLEGRLAESGGTVIVEGLPSLDADPFQMRQLFQNLIANALKFRKEGVPPVVTLTSQRLAGGIWEIAVEDNGIGFDEKHGDRIFRPFERLHGRSAFEGTGMGLAICQKIACRHNGGIAAKSVPLEGARFMVRLPEKQAPRTDFSSFPNSSPSRPDIA
ncbi:MAG: PAS domain S-box protein [Nitrospinae bacterium]|nr:PAS domain S-box protein [Nitrospinota bacterium]